MGLSDRNFKRLCTLVSAEAGIKLTEAKRLMLEGRLQKRMRALGIGSHDQYCEYLFSNEGQKNELNHMIDRVTTNKTDFFREPRHFEYLRKKILPLLVSEKKGRKLYFWSAGCSSGEEPYTLAMILQEFKEENPRGSVNFEILGTDLSTRVLETARNAVYPHERIQPVPLPLRKKYLLRSRNKEDDRVRIVPELRAAVRFQRLNFKAGTFNLNQLYDVIFCRNVIIYFDKETRFALMQKFLAQLSPGGYFFLGHSESLHDLDLPLVQVDSNIYRKAT